MTKSEIRDEAEARFNKWRAMTNDEVECCKENGFDYWLAQVKSEQSQ